MALYTVLRPRNNGYFQVRRNQSPEKKLLSSHRKETKYQVANWDRKLSYTGAENKLTINLLQKEGGFR